MNEEMNKANRIVSLPPMDFKSDGFLRKRPVSNAGRNPTAYLTP